MQANDAQALVLCVLADGPMHGYAGPVDLQGPRVARVAAVGLKHLGVKPA
jgi:hypothetical protein